MSQECSSKTITEIISKKATIHCFADMKQDGTTTPSLYRADLLDTEKEINGVNGKEGELLLTHNDNNPTVGEINESGELSISLDNDDVSKYSNNEGELIYDE
jgi:hypothetical protein